jgi:hypothetical protein
MRRANYGNVVASARAVVYDFDSLVLTGSEDGNGRSIFSLRNTWGGEMT